MLPPGEVVFNDFNKSERVSPVKRCGFVRIAADRRVKELAVSRELKGEHRRCASCQTVYTFGFPRTPGSHASSAIDFQDHHG